MNYPDVQRTDAVHQGKMIILGSACACLAVWVMEFLTTSPHVVPGFLYDQSGGIFFELAGLLFMFGFSSLFFLLLWAGVGWSRYVFGIYLVMLGLANVIFSMEAGGTLLGGASLVLGVVYLGSAGGLVLSIGVDRYLQDRRQKGVPWLQLLVAVASLLAVLAIVVMVQLGQTFLAVLEERERETLAVQVLTQLAENGDMQAVAAIANDKLKKEMTQSDFAGQLNAYQPQMGAYRDSVPPPHANLAEIVLNRAPSSEEYFCLKAHFEHAEVDYYLTLDETSSPWRATQLAFRVQPDKRK